MISLRYQLQHKNYSWTSLAFSTLAQTDKGEVFGYAFMLCP